MGAENPLSPLEQKLSHLLSRRLAKSTLRSLTLPLPNQIDFSSNDFLSLSTSPILKSAYLSALQKSNLPLGSGGSRLLDGNSRYAETLEREIAAFHGAETGLLFNSGFDANVGFFSCMPQKGDVVVYDELVHASVHDGMRLSRAGSCIPFAHNSVEGLKEVLLQLRKDMQEEQKGGNGHGKKSVFIAVEAIYSMDGDVAPLADIVSTVEQHLPSGTGYIVVDEAHSTGVLGPQGRGLVCSLGLENRVFARLHTFGKALAGNGAILLLPSPLLKSYLLNYSRPLIYTTSPSYPSLALLRTTYSLLFTSSTTSLQTHLHSLTSHFHTLLTTLHNTSPPARRTLRIPQICPQSPIFAIKLEKPRVLAKYLQERGMMVRAVVPPTVPEGTQRVRVCLHAGNTVAEVEMLVRALGKWCEEQERQQHQQGKEGARVIEEEKRVEERARL